jgi:hypothetical protein
MLRLAALLVIVFLLLNVDRCWRRAQAELLPGYRGNPRSANPEHYSPIGREWRRRYFRAWLLGGAATALLIALLATGLI